MPCEIEWYCNCHRDTSRLRCILPHNNLLKVLWVISGEECGIKGADALYNYAPIIRYACVYNASHFVWKYHDIVLVHIIILSLSHQDSNDQYWPTEEGSSDTYGKLRVSLLSEEISTAYTTRTLELVESQLHGQTKKAKVVQFHVQNWPPSTSSVILDLIERVNRVQMGQGRVPITVMCK